MTEQQKQQLKKWVVENMMAIEFGTLDDKKRTLFLTMVEERKDDEFMQECFTTFELIKKDFCKKQEEEEEEEEDKQCRDCEIEAKKHCDECGGYGSDDDDDEEEEEEDYNTQTSPPYYCDGGCGKKVGEGHDHDCDRVCPDCKEEEE